MCQFIVKGEQIVRWFSPRLKKVHIQLITRFYELDMNRQNEKKFKI